MKTITLRRKCNPCATMQILDDVIISEMSATIFIIILTGCGESGAIKPISDAIENFEFPDVECKLYEFLKAYDNKVLGQFSFYKK